MRRSRERKREQRGQKQLSHTMDAQCLTLGHCTLGQGRNLPNCHYSVLPPVLSLLLESTYLFFCPRAHHLIVVW